MLEDVLAVRRPVLQPAEELDELGVQVRDRELERGRLPFVPDLLPELRPHLLDDLFDPRRVDPSVDDELFQGEPGDLAPDRLERADHDRLGGVVDDQVDARRGLQGPDVAALPPDDAALEVVGGELDDRDRRLHHRVGGEPLDRHPDVVAGLLGRLLGRLLLDPPHEPRGLDPRLVLDRSDEVALGVGGGQARDLLQPALLLLDHLEGVGVGLFDPLLGVGQAPLLAGELLVALLLLGELAVEVLFLLGDPLLEGGHFLPAGLDGLVELHLGGEDPLLRLDRRLAQPRLPGPGGLGQGAVGVLADRRALAFDLTPEEKVREQSERDRHDRHGDRDRD